MSNYYKDLLLKARQEKIDVFDLTIANETMAIFGKNNTQFERLCQVMSDLYLRTYHIALDTLGNALKYALENGDVKLDKLYKGEEDFDFVIELACSMD